MKNILSKLLGQFMSGNGLPFVGNFYVYLQIQTKYQILIHPLLWFSIQLQMPKMSVFKYNYKYTYIFEPNPESEVSRTYPHPAKKRISRAQVRTPSLKYVLCPQQIIIIYFIHTQRQLHAHTRTHTHTHTHTHAHTSKCSHKLSGIK